MINHNTWSSRTQFANLTLCVLLKIFLLSSKIFPVSSPLNHCMETQPSLSHQHAFPLLVCSTPVSCLFGNVSFPPACQLDHPPVVLCLHGCLQKKKKKKEVDQNDSATTILSVNTEGRRGDAQEPETVLVCVCVCWRITGDDTGLAGITLDGYLRLLGFSYVYPALSHLFPSQH